MIRINLSYEKKKLNEVESYLALVEVASHECYQESTPSNSGLMNLNFAIKIKSSKWMAYNYTVMRLNATTMLPTFIGHCAAAA